MANNQEDERHVSVTRRSDGDDDQFTLTVAGTPVEQHYTRLGLIQIAAMSNRLGDLESLLAQGIKIEKENLLERERFEQ